MAESPIKMKSTFEARALLVGDRIDLRAFSTASRLLNHPLTVQVGETGIAVLFRHGVVVFFNVAPVEEVSFLQMLKPLIHGHNTSPETELVKININPEEYEGIKHDVITLKDRTIERLSVVAEVLSKSVALERYELEINRSFERVEPFAAEMELHGTSGRKARLLLKHLGAALLSEHRMVGRVEVGDKPEIIWERPDLERLYIRLEDEYEIKERHAVLERKLTLIRRTAQTIHDLLQSRRTLRVEWYIVILIVMEIIIMLYELVWQSHS